MRCHHVSLSRLLEKTTQFTSIFHNLAFTTSCWRTRSRSRSCSALSRRSTRCILCVRYFSHEGDKKGGEREYIRWVFGRSCRWSRWGISYCRMDRSRSLGGGDQAQEESSRGEASIENSNGSLPGKCYVLIFRN